MFVITYYKQIKLNVYNVTRINNLHTIKRYESQVRAFSTYDSTRSDNK